jgi:hypothetical protein
MLGGNTLAQYTTLKNQLLSILAALSPTSACSTFFNGQAGHPTLEQLSEVVTSIVPFNGPLSNLSLFAAGMWTSKGANADTLNTEVFPAQWRVGPVCNSFLGSGPGGWNGTVAMAQTQPPAHDVYFATQSAALNSLLQSTILHEALHNLTGLGGDDLYLFLTENTGIPGGIPGPALPSVLSGPSFPINTALVQMGCAAK